MKYIFVDESGDFTIGDKDGPYFVMIAIVTEDRKGLENVMRRAKRNILSKKERSKVAEVKASGSTTRFKEYFYRKLAEFKNFKIYIIHLDKRKLKKFKGKVAAVYLRALKELLHQADLKSEKSFHIIVDEKPLSGMATSALITALTEEFVLQEDKPKTAFINFDSTPNILGLHVADFIAWAVFQKYKREELHWYNTFKKMVGGESELDLS